MTANMLSYSCQSVLWKQTTEVGHQQAFADKEVVPQQPEKVGHVVLGNMCSPKEA